MMIPAPWNTPGRATGGTMREGGAISPLARAIFCQRLILSLSLVSVRS